MAGDSTDPTSAGPTSQTPVYNIPFDFYWPVRSVVAPSPYTTCACVLGSLGRPTLILSGRLTRARTGVSVRVRRSPRGEDTRRPSSDGSLLYGNWPHPGPSTSSV